VCPPFFMVFSTKSFFLLPSLFLHLDLRPNSSVFPLLQFFLGEPRLKRTRLFFRQESFYRSFTLFLFFFF